MWLTFLIFIIFLTPFLFWNYGTFIEDIIEYPAGKSAHVLPVVGYGISYFLYMIGIIKDQWDYYPFWIWQVIFCLPLFYYFVRKQKINNNLKQLVFNYGVFVFVFLFFSRYLNTNYISYLSMIFLSAYLIEDKYFLKKTVN